MSDDSKNFMCKSCGETYWTTYHIGKCHVCGKEICLRCAGFVKTGYNKNFCKNCTDFINERAIEYVDELVEKDRKDREEERERNTR